MAMEIEAVTCLSFLGPQLEEDHLERENASAYRPSLINPLKISLKGLVSRERQIMSFAIEVESDYKIEICFNVNLES